MEKHLKTLIQIIKTGSRAEVKEAQKQVEKFWQHFYIPHREEGAKAFTVFLEEIKKIEEIKDWEHQAYLINTLKWPLMVIGEEHFEIWKEFILKYIQHPSGIIRQAVVRATGYLIFMGLTLDTSLQHRQNKMTDLEFTEKVEDNIMRFGMVILEVENLIERYSQPKYRRIKYISSLPAGVYKSLQMLLKESLLPSEYYEKLLHKFMALTQERINRAILEKFSSKQLH